MAFRLRLPATAEAYRYASGEVKHGVHFRRFSKEFLGRNRWFAIRISKSVLLRLKYIALYVTSPTCQITHYGRIRAIKPWRDSGKYIVLLREKAKRIGPIGFSPKINIQAPRLALMARLQRARTLADALKVHSGQLIQSSTRSPGITAKWRVFPMTRVKFVGADLVQTLDTLRIRMIISDCVNGEGGIYKQDRNMFLRDSASYAGPHN